MSDSKTTWMDEAAKAFASAAKTNADLLRKGTQLFKGTLSLPFDVSRIITESSSTISKGMASYLRLYATHTSELLDLGLKVSNDLLAVFERVGESAQRRADEQPKSSEAVSELHLQGSPGDQCRGAFILENNKAEAVSARMRHSRFVNATTGAAAVIPIVFHPGEATVAPGEKFRVTVEVGIPEGTPGGVYESTVWIEGFPELRLLIVLSVADAERASGRTTGEPHSKKSSRQRRSKSGGRRSAKRDGL